MSKYEIKKMFFWRKSRWLPCGLNIREQLWWRFMPGVVINVRWPKGEVVIDESMPQWDWTIGPSKYIVESADPNDHYRPWMEQHVGCQGWDWDWGFVGNDVSNNCLTIKVRQTKAKYATIIALNWT